MKRTTNIGFLCGLSQTQQIRHESEISDRSTGEYGRQEKAVEEKPVEEKPVECMKEN